MKKFLITLTTVIGVVAGSFSTVSADDKELVEVYAAVKLEPGASLAAVAGEAEATPGPVLIELRGIHAVSRLVEVDTSKPEKIAKESEKLAKDVAGEDGVAWAVELEHGLASDTRFHAWPSNTATESTADMMAGQAAFADLRLDDAHGVATGAGVVVAVLDTGVDVDHPFLAGHLLPGVDLVDGDLDPSDEADGIDQDLDGHADSAYGHGTFVSGIVRQIAPDAQILPIRVLDAEGQGDLHAVIDGIDYAVANGADVINMSFGLDTAHKYKALEKALKRAKKADVVVVAAAGNDGDEEKSFPSAMPDVVSVTALDQASTDVATYATRGKWVKVAAPGADIVSSTADDRYATWSGTSMAAPVVSGSLALLSQHVADTDVKKRVEPLLKSCRKLGEKNWADHGGLDLTAALGLD